MKEIKSVIIESADAALNFQDEDGSMPSGHNGPWKQNETPVRNTSHWLITFSKADQHSNHSQYRDAAEKCANYLISNESYINSNAFIHREVGGKDKTNGLIGQAWTIEALVEAYLLLDDEEYLNVSKNVFEKHKFDSRCGLWNRIDLDGNPQKKDPTLNHQIWFAGAGSMLAEFSIEIKNNIATFLDKLNKNMGLRENGRICHGILPSYSIKDYMNVVSGGELYIPFRNLRYSGKEMLGKRKIRDEKEIGYHAFNLYGLGLLKSNFPDHLFWKNEKIHSSVQYLMSGRYKKAINNNRYGYPYNPVGFEVPYVADAFEVENLNKSYWVESQLNKHYNAEESLMFENTEDPNTLASRLYEATRLDMN